VNIVEMFFFIVFWTLFIIANILMAWNYETHSISSSQDLILGWTRHIHPRRPSKNTLTISDISTGMEILITAVIYIAQQYKAMSGFLCTILVMASSFTAYEIARTALEKANAVHSADKTVSFVKNLFR
jgi:hypothetical protein